MIFCSDGSRCRCGAKATITTIGSNYGICDSCRGAQIERERKKEEDKYYAKKRLEPKYLAARAYLESLPGWADPERQVEISECIDQMITWERHFNEK